MTTTEPNLAPDGFTYEVVLTGPGNGIEVWTPTPDDGSRSIRVTDSGGCVAAAVLPADQVKFLITALSA